MSSRLSVHLLLLVAAAMSCSPAKPTGPRDAGASSRAFVGDAELEVRYRYEPQVGKELILFVDTTAHRGAVGAVRVSLRLNGFTVIRGESAWDADVASSNTDTHQVTLRAVERAPSVTIVTHHIERDAQLATDELRFWVDDDGQVAECMPENEGCEER